MSEVCATCKWRSNEPRVNADRGTAEFTDTMYFCHRRAPVVTGGLHCPTMTVWPMVTSHDKCGDHEGAE